MRFVQRWVGILLVICVLLLLVPLIAVAQEHNPMVQPYEMSEYTELTDSYINILLLGIDLGWDGYWGSGGKRDIADCHTDADMVIAINLDQQRIDLISLPRDTVTYVPGVKGLYKFNGAVHCAQSLQGGLAKTKQAAQWLLGNVKIDYYFAVDMQTMVAIGDAIGGADMDLEMKYQGSSGRRYSKGMQHLDGIGIMDYLRARTNATVNYTDIGRTNRQRQMMLAIFDKLRNDPEAMVSLLKTADAEYPHFYTDIGTSDMEQLLKILPVMRTVTPDSIGAYVLTGPYLGKLGWNFTYTDQEHRQNVITKVYGFTPDPIPYVSSQYTIWLMDTGFTTIRYIDSAQKLMAYANALDADTLSQQQCEAVQMLQTTLQDTIITFDTAASTLDDGDTRAMATARKALHEAADVCAEALHYSQPLSWSHYNEEWFNDPQINAYQFNWR